MRRVEFDGEVTAGGVIYPAYTDGRGVLWLDVEEDIEVIVDGALIGGEVWPAYIDPANGRLIIEDVFDD